MENDKNSQNSKVVEFYAELKHETHKEDKQAGAYLFFDGVNDIWIPKSLTISVEHIKDNNYSIEIPEWVALDKGII